MQNQNLTILKEKVVCLRCDGNGYIYRARLIPPQQEVFICDECDATWLDIQSIYKNNFIDLTTYLGSLGYSYNDVKIVDINYDWYK